MVAFPEKYDKGGADLFLPMKLLYRCHRTAIKPLHKVMHVCMYVCTMQMEGAALPFSFRPMALRSRASQCVGSSVVNW
jgi:hypothetical protein